MCRIIIILDVFERKCHSMSNIPARPLPQGMLNHGGFYHFDSGMMGVPAGGTIGMRFEVQI